MEPENMYAAPKVEKNAIGNKDGKTCSLHKVQEKIYSTPKGGNIQSVTEERKHACNPKSRKL